MCDWLYVNTYIPPCVHRVQRAGSVGSKLTLADLLLRGQWRYIGEKVLDGSWLGPVRKFRPRGVLYTENRNFKGTI